MIKKLILLFAALVFMAGCWSYAYLEWGDAKYESINHELEDLKVTRVMPDGTKITITVRASKTHESQAIAQALETAAEAIRENAR